MSGTIEIRGLRVMGVHGALAHEKELAQPFEIDLSIETSVEDAAASDALEDALDYGPVVASVVRVVAEERFSLLEALAEAIATTVLADERVHSVRVGVSKLRPPLPVDVASVGVRIERHRGAARRG
jgi:FolB domain-containing protein